MYAQIIIPTVGAAVSLIAMIISILGAKRANTQVKSELHTKQTNEYETAVALYEYATGKDIFDSMDSIPETALDNKNSPNLSPEILDLETTRTRIRLEQEALRIQDILIDSEKAQPISQADTSADDSHAIIKIAIDKAINDAIRSIDEHLPKVLTESSEHYLSEYFPDQTDENNEQEASETNNEPLTTESSPVFQTHAKALRVFGYEYKQWLRGWKALDGNQAVWFPVIHGRNTDWINTLSKDGETITEEPKSNELISRGSDSDDNPINENTKIAVFAYNNWDGKFGYKFIGVFTKEDRKGQSANSFKLIGNKIQVNSENHSFKTEGTE